MKRKTKNLRQEIQNFLHISKNPLLVILGPTASGKTDYSIRLAQEIQKETGRGVEIVNADSRQLYKYLDIGTGKVTREEMRGIPHHLLDVLDPTEEVTAAWYKEHATKTIDTILGEGKIPLLVGGSMLYLSAIIDDLQFPEKGNEDNRKKLEEEYRKDGGQSLYQKLRQVDPETADAFSQDNMPYVVRALEIYEQTGKKPSEARQKGKSRYDLFILGMQWERTEMKQRIEKRTKELFQKGWIDEVQELLKRGYKPADPGMKSHGYREIMEYLQSGLHDQEALEATILRKTQAYAKRQMTWWKQDGRIRWVDPGGN